MTILEQVRDLIREHISDPQEAQALLERLATPEEARLVLALKHSVLIDLPRHMLKAAAYPAGEAGAALDAARGLEIDEADQSIAGKLQELAESLRFRDNSDEIDEMVDYWGEQRVILDAFSSHTGMVSDQLQTHEAVEELMKRKSSLPGMLGWLDWGQVFGDLVTRVAGRPEAEPVKMEQLINGVWTDAMSPATHTPASDADLIPLDEHCLDQLGDREKALLDTMIQDLANHQGDAASAQTMVDQWFEDYMANGGFNLGAMMVAFVYAQHTANAENSSVLIEPKEPVDRRSSAELVRSWLNEAELEYIDEMVELRKKMDDCSATAAAKRSLELQEELEEKDGVNAELLRAAATRIESMDKTETIVVRREEHANWLSMTAFPGTGDDITYPWIRDFYFGIAGDPLRPDGTVIDVDAYGADISEAVSVIEREDGGVELAIRYMGAHRMIGGSVFLWNEQEYEHMFPLLLATDPEGYFAKELLVAGKKHYVVSEWNQD